MTVGNRGVYAPKPYILLGQLLQLPPWFHRLWFKMFCLQLRKAKVGWDDPLSDEFLERWSQLLSMLKGARPISITQCVHQLANPKVAQLVKFCDALIKAYAAVVYLRHEDGDVRFLATKTRVAPVHGITIPWLELLSTLLLSKLLTSTL